MTFCQDIEKIITEKLPDALVFVSDPQRDGCHLEAIVVSEVFQEISLIEQHRIVMNSLKESFDSSLHALKLKTYTPTKWKQINGGEL